MRCGSGRVSALFLLAFQAVAGCSSTEIAGPDPSSLAIRLEVSGGLIGVDYTIVVDGQHGVALGEVCVRGCDFAPGSVLVPLSSFQLTDLATTFERAGALAYDGADFGDPCCDQIRYRLTYVYRGRQSVFAGSSGALPRELAVAIARVHALERGRLPVVMAPASVPADWPADRLVINHVSIAGAELQITATHSGGCADHAIDVVAWNGFLESQPVRLGMAVAHDARADACDALIRTTRTFDLTPVRVAWNAAYGAGPGTVILLIRDPGSGNDFLAEFRF